MEQQRSIFGPLLLIAAGAIWLLVSAGRIPSANLWALTHIWPYLLIAAGLGLILRQYWRYTSILLDVIVIGGAVLAIVFAPRLGWNSPSIFGVFTDSDFNFGPGERGSGNIIKQTRDVGDFTAIELDYPAQVNISQGDAISVEIEADDDVLPGLKTEVRAGTLRIYYKADEGRRVTPTKTVRITIVVKDLKDVEFDSAGDLTISGLETDALEVSLSGAGNLELDEVTVKDLSVSLSGAGSMTASGTTEDLRLVISGFGDYKGADLHGKTANVNISGAGSATVWVDDELDATISGAGSVNYYGSPNVTRQISGVGSVSKSGDK